jgi:molybdate transport system permease protein
LPALTPLEIETLQLSLRVGVVSVAASLPFGIAVAWLLARRQFPGKILLDGLVHLPLVLPPVVVGYGLLVLLGRNGPIGGWLYDVFGVTFAFNWKGAALASAAMAFPLMVRAMRLSLELVDRRLEAAARTLGAGRLRVFLTITVPLMAPGILTGAILGFARSISEFGATITFVSNIPGETQTISSAIYSLIQTPDGDTAAARLVIISIVLAVGALIAAEVFARRATARLHGQ